MGSKTHSIHLFATEIAILQYQYASPKIDLTSRHRLKTILELRRSQAIGASADLFAALLDSKQREWTAHWNSWAPGAPLRDPADMATSLDRFATEIAVLEFQCVDGGLGPGAVKAVARTIDRCYSHAMCVDADFRRTLLWAKRREWVKHWLAWGPSFDGLGRLEYGVIGGTDQLMVGTMVMTKRSEDGRADVVMGLEEVAEKVRVEYERWQTRVMEEGVGYY